MQGGARPKRAAAAGDGEKPEHSRVARGETFHWIRKSLCVAAITGSQLVSCPDDDPFPEESTVRWTDTRNCRPECTADCWDAGRRSSQPIWLKKHNASKAVSERRIVTWNGMGADQRCLRLPFILPLYGWQGKRFHQLIGSDSEGRVDRRTACKRSYVRAGGFDEAKIMFQRYCRFASL
jgi:hypothetical protein